MKDFSRVLKFITDNRQDIDHSSNEHLAKVLYKFFYGANCFTCASDKIGLGNEPCSSCNFDNFPNWSPK